MAPTGKTIAFTTLAQTTLRVVEIIIGVITLGLITRYLTPAGFGQFTTVNALLQFFIIIVDFGLYLTLLREISAHEDRMGSIANNIFTMRLFATTILLITALVLVRFSPYDDSIRQGVSVLALSFLSASLISTVTALFQKQLRMVSIGIINVLNKSVSLGAVYLVVTANLGVQGIFASYSLIGIATFITVWYALTRLPQPIRLRLAVDMAYWREVVLKTWPIAVTIVLNLVYFKADTIILSLYQSQESVGIYGAAYRVLEIITAFPHMFMGLILPLLTAAWVAHDTVKLQGIWERAFIFFAGLTVPLAVGGTLLGKEIMILVAGKDFAPSGAVLGILMFATATIFFGTLYTYMVLVIEKQKSMIKYFFLTAVISLVGYLFTIPRYSYWGAAWMTVVSEIMIVVSAWIVIRSEVRLTIPWVALLKIVIGSIIMGALTWTLALYLPVLVVITLSFLSYGALMYVFRVVPPNELKQLITG